MSDLTNQKHTGSSNLQSSAQENRKSLSPSLTHEPIENTPFVLVGTEETGYFVGIGSYRLTPTLKTVQEVETFMGDHMWEIIVSLIQCVTDRMAKEATQFIIDHVKEIENKKNISSSL